MWPPASPAGAPAQDGLPVTKSGPGHRRRRGRHGSGHVHRQHGRWPLAGGAGRQVGWQCSTWWPAPGLRLSGLPGRAHRQADETPQHRVMFNSQVTETSGFVATSSPPSRPRRATRSWNTASPSWPPAASPSALRNISMASTTTSSWPSTWKGLVAKDPGDQRQAGRLHSMRGLP